jgi:hypothetical protein
MSNVIRFNTGRTPTRPNSPALDPVDRGEEHHAGTTSPDALVGAELQARRVRLIAKLRNLYLGIELLTVTVNELALTNPELVEGTQHALNELESVKLRVGLLRRQLETMAADWAELVGV